MAEAAPVPALLTIPEVAARLGGIHRQTVYRRIHDGEIAATNIGPRRGRTKLRVSEGALAAYISARTMAPRRAA